MRKVTKHMKRYVPLLLTLFAFIAGCGRGDAGSPSSVIKIVNVSYDPTRELDEEINQAFIASYKAQTGQTVEIEQSHGGSAKQSQAVLDGLHADVVTLALPADIDAIAKAGLIHPDWQTRLPQNASPYTSTIIFLVRKGNPKGIKDWPDLVKGGVAPIVPNPKTSGGGRWGFLAAWGSALKLNNNDEAKTQKYITDLYRAVPVLDTGARGSTQTFAHKKIGDVLIAWENEAWLALKEFPDEHFEIVYPSISILAEPPVAVVDKFVDERGTRAAAEAYLKFFYTPEAQEIIAANHYRPRDTAILQKYQADLPPLKLFTIDKVFGGWSKAQPRFFDDGGVFDQIYKNKNK